MTISTITMPIMRMPSVEPISDRSSCAGVGVIWRKIGDALVFKADAEDRLNVAVANAMTSAMHNTVIAKTWEVFIILLVIIVSCWKWASQRPICTFLHFRCIMPKVICWRVQQVIFYGEYHGNYHESRMPNARPDVRRDGFCVRTFSSKFFIILYM